VGIREHLASADDHPLLLGWDGFQKELTNLLGVCSKPFETVTFFFPCSPPLMDGSVEVVVVLLAS
jgi:hypothetical protein